MSQVLPAAVQWFRQAGTVLAALALERAADGQRRDQVGQLCRESGLIEHGFTVRRWDFWRGRLEAIAATGGETAEMAREGLRYMHASGEG